MIIDEFRHPAPIFDFFYVAMVTLAFVCLAILPQKGQHLNPRVAALLIFFGGGIL